MNLILHKLIFFLILSILIGHLIVVIPNYYSKSLCISAISNVLEILVLD